MCLCVTKIGRVASCIRLADGPGEKKGTMEGFRFILGISEVIIFVDIRVMFIHVRVGMFRQIVRLYLRNCIQDAIN